LEADTLSCDACTATEAVNFKSLLDFQLNSFQDDIIALLKNERSTLVVKECQHHINQISESMSEYIRKRKQRLDELEKQSSVISDALCSCSSSSIPSCLRTVPVCASCKGQPFQPDRSRYVHCSDEDDDDRAKVLLCKSGKPFSLRTARRLSSLDPQSPEWRGFNSMLDIGSFRYICECMKNPSEVLQGHEEILDDPAAVEIKILYESLQTYFSDVEKGTVVLDLTQCTERIHEIQELLTMLPNDSTEDESIHSNKIQALERLSEIIKVNGKLIQEKDIWNSEVATNFTNLFPSVCTTMDLVNRTPSKILLVEIEDYIVAMEKHMDAILNYHSN